MQFCNTDDQITSKYQSQLRALLTPRKRRNEDLSGPGFSEKLSAIQQTSETFTLQATETVPKQHHPLHVHFYSQHQLQLLLSQRLRLQGHSTDCSPPGIWFNPDQMLIGAVCLLAICLGFRSTVASCAEPCGAGLPCQRLGCPETTSQPEDTSWPIVANQHSLWTDSAVGNAIKLIFLWIIGQLVHTLPLTPLKSISEGFKIWAIGCWSSSVLTFSLKLKAV